MQLGLMYPARSSKALGSLSQLKIIKQNSLTKVNPDAHPSKKRRRKTEYPSFRTFFIFFYYLLSRGKQFSLVCIAIRNRTNWVIDVLVDCPDISITKRPRQKGKVHSRRTSKKSLELAANLY